MNARAVLIKAFKALRVIAARKVLNGLTRLLSVGVKIQMPAVCPGVARDDRAFQ